MGKRVVALFFLATVIVASAQNMSNPGAQMAAAAQRFLSALSPGQRGAASIPFGDAERQNWHYIPRDRRALR